MFTVHSPATAIFFCVLTMIGWGSWANTQKLAGKERWPFNLFYWDYSIGVAVAGLVFCFTLGAWGAAGSPPAANLAAASSNQEWQAVAAGALFNLANILIVAAIDAAGLAVAFPVGIGLALVIGTVVNYIQVPKGDRDLLTAGVVLILVAMIASAFAHTRIPKTTEQSRKASGLMFAVTGGVLMGFFYPQLMKAISPNFNSEPPRPGFLTPYTALLFFGLGVLVSNIPLNGLFMYLRGSRMGEYTTARPGMHLPGILGGIIWMAALTFNVIASGVAGPAISYALGQGATLIATLWGIFVWREFRTAPASVNYVLALMLLAYSVGIFLIGRATV